MKIIITLLLTLQLFALDSLKERLALDHILTAKILYPLELEKIYISNDYNLTWKNPHSREALIIALQNSQFHGIDPRLLHLKEIEEISDPAAQDILLNDAILSYISTLEGSLIDPKKLHKFWNIEKKSFDLQKRYETLLSLPQEEYNNYFEALAPQHFLYQNTKAWLIHYLELQKQLSTTPKIELISPLLYSDEDPAILQIRTLLFYEGFLTEDSHSELFDSEFEDALKAYQRHHGKKADGILGKSTLKLFETPLKDRVATLSLNLERARWVLQVLDDEYIVVNIASYLLYYIKDSKILFSTPVIVGKQMHETPIFAGKMHYIVYNPTWTVPFSIAAKEILPKVQKDPHYMQKKNLELLDRRMMPVEDTNIDFSLYSSENFPYTFRQKSGKQNALGRVKFLFPNSNAIYLHDTPARYLFSQKKREFSHGCIRVKNPFTLAEILLKQQNLWSSDIKALEKDLTTTKITLKKQIPTLLMYWTAAADIKGNIYFYEDHYHLDRNLQKAIDKKIEESILK